MFYSALFFFSPGSLFALADFLRSPRVWQAELRDETRTFLRRPFQYKKRFALAYNHPLEGA